MPSLKSLKTRIASVKSTQKITKAMQLISASRLHRAKDALYASIPYREEVARLLRIIQYGGYSVSHMTCGNAVANSQLLIIATSDRGLCGSFNAGIIKRARNIFLECINQKKKIHAIFIGKKGYEILRHSYEFETCELFDNGKEVSFCCALRITDLIFHLFLEKGLGVCDLLYNEFISTITQKVVQRKLLPLFSSMGEGEMSEEVESYMCEPFMEEMQDMVIKRHVAAQIYGVLLETAAGEHSARMIAMDNANRNSKKMLQKLSNVYNRTRQANITKELTEIVSGAQAI